MFGLVPAAVAINDQAGGALLKWATQSVHPGDGKRDGLNNSGGASLLRFHFGMNV
jgi:hypothetical protein